MQNQSWKHFASPTGRRQLRFFQICSHASQTESKVRNLIKYSDRVSLDRDLLTLEKALNGKVPGFDTSEDWQLPVLIEQYRNRNVDVYLNSAVDSADSWSSVSNEWTDIVNCADITLPTICVHILIQGLLFMPYRLKCCVLLNSFLTPVVYISRFVLHSCSICALNTNFIS